MAIKELITLEGSEEVKKQLADLGKSGEDFIASVNNLGTSQNPQLQQVFETIKKGTAANVEHGKSVSQLTTLYHLLHPALTAAGASMAEFRGFSVAAHLGISGLAVALGAALTVALARISDQTAATSARLATLLNLKGPGAGESIFAGLEADAAKVGTSIKTLQPVIESFVSAIRQAKAATGAVFVVPPGQTGPEFLRKDLTDAKDAAVALDEALRLGGKGQAEAATEAKKFGDALTASGKVTGALIRQLDPFGGGIEAIAKALNLTGLNAQQLANRLDLLPRSTDELIRGLIRLKPELDAALQSKGAPTQFADAIDRITAAWGRFGEKIASTSVGRFILETLAKIPEDAGLAIDAVKKDFTDLLAFLTSIWESIKTGATDAWTFVANIFSQAFTLSTWEGIFNSFFSLIVTLAQGAWDKIKSIFSVPINPNIGGAGGATGPGGAPFASGGLVRGSGSTTSDSILAWLSNREFVINAKAVDHYGPNFFSALNAMRLPKDFGFSMGGLVRSMIGPMPRMAAGGMAMAGTPVNITIGQNTFNLSAPEETAKKLKQYSISSQLSSSGRKPSWVR